MSTARLRHAFKYPDDNTPEGIDEQEQEQLIIQLQQQDTTNTLIYRNIFLAFPLLGTLFFLYRVPSAPSFENILAVSCLCSTTYILYGIPLRSGDLDDAILGMREDLDFGPLQRYLVPLTGVLASVLALSGYVSVKRNPSPDGIYSVLPLVIFSIVMLVRTQLRPVDINELSNLKYDYKGA